MTVRRMSLALLAMLSVFAATVNATILTAGTYTYNANLTSAIPYPFAGAEVRGASLAAGQSLTLGLFQGLNATDTQVVNATISNPVSPFFIETASSDAGLLDGLFSVQLVLNTGTIDVTSLVAFTTNSISTIPLVFTASQNLLASAVPEPATVALLGLGLFGIAMARRRSH